MKHSLRNTSMALVALGGSAMLLATPPALAGPGCEKGPEMAAARSEVFAEADADGSGALDVAELEQFHSLMRKRMQADRFSRLDADGDGGITLDELESARPKGPHGPPPF